jgi:hypothetical protein
MSKLKGIPIVLSDRTKDSGQEFGRAGKGTRVLLSAFHLLLKEGKEQRLCSRLTSRLLQVVQSDPLNDRGDRCIEQGDLSLLEGFDFYLKHQLLRLLPDWPAVTMNREQGECLITVAPFRPQDWIPDGISTHLMITAAVAAIDFKRERFTTYTSASDPLRVDEMASTELRLALPSASSLPLVVVAGLQLLEVVNGKAYPLSGRALQVVKVEPGVGRPEPEVQHRKPGGSKQKSTSKQPSTVVASHKSKSTKTK